MHPSSLVAHAIRRPTLLFHALFDLYPLACRGFHWTASTARPPRFRHRTFATTNPSLSGNQKSNGNEPAGTSGSSGGGSISGTGDAGESSHTPESPSESATTTPTQKRQPKRKPRSSGAKHSLRRVAIIAQQPSRIAPSGRSPAQDASAVEEEGDSTDWSRSIRAVCAAEGYEMEVAVGILRQHGFSLDPDGAGFEAHEVVHARGAGSGDIFVFPSGTVVTWGLPMDIGKDLATKQLLPAAVDPHVNRAEKEDMDFIRDPSKDTSSIKGDAVVLGTHRESHYGERLDTTFAQIAFSSGLARSTKLAVLESQLTDYIESTRWIPHMLSRSEKVPVGRAFILQKTGELLSLRAQLNHYSELTDSLPDIFWDSRQELGLEGYYDEVGRALDVGIRIKTLNQKMDYAQEIASVLREMSSEKHNTRLEWIIIVLIAVEVLFELRRVWNERMEDIHRGNPVRKLERTISHDDDVAYGG